MSREKKAQIIEGLQEVFSKCSAGIFTDYRGLSASEMTILRRNQQATCPRASTCPSAGTCPSRRYYHFARFRCHHRGGFGSDQYREL